MQDTRWLTPDALLRRLGLENITLSETDSTRIESALRIAQAEIETLTGRRYAPLMKTVVHWARPGDVMLALRDDLLELSSVRDADGVDYAIADITWHGGILCLPDGVQAPRRAGRDRRAVGVSSRAGSSLSRHGGRAGFGG